MLRNPNLLEVWCETEDDVTLLWNTGVGTLVEFVQVKAAEHTQLWSLALLCGGGGDSIIARSLAHDRCAEPCCFRIVTRVGIHPERYLLSLDRRHAARNLGEPGARKLHAAVCGKIGDVMSPSGHTASHWLAEVLWHVGESEQALTNQNLIGLQEYLEENDELLFTDQLRELYDQVLFRVQSAAIPKWKSGAKKRNCLAAILSDGYLLSSSA